MKFQLCLSACAVTNLFFILLFFPLSSPLIPQRPLEEYSGGWNRISLAASLVYSRTVNNRCHSSNGKCHHHGVSNWISLAQQENTVYSLYRQSKSRYGTNRQDELHRDKRERARLTDRQPDNHSVSELVGSRVDSYRHTSEQ